ncbi:hypothetical protein XENORESO_012535 [Xenotaenia resolanae]|uniref:Uncharacterized protein n=1 Tax=Xenotaenia resolanae TaxID=208358 RepID=A0ABV0X9Z2_9TELE
MSINWYTVLYFVSPSYSRHQRQTCTGIPRLSAASADAFFACTSTSGFLESFIMPSLFATAFLPFFYFYLMYNHMLNHSFAFKAACLHYDLHSAVCFFSKCLKV